MARGPEWEAMIGTRLSASIWSNTASELWLASINMPSRFISATHCRPSGDRPFQCGVSVALSPSWLLRKGTGPAGRVAGLVVGEGGRPGEPDSEPVEGGEQGQVLAERPAILHADEGEMLAL